MSISILFSIIFFCCFHNLSQKHLWKNAKWKMWYGWARRSRIIIIHQGCDEIHGIICHQASRLTVLFPNFQSRMKMYFGKFHWKARISLRLSTIFLLKIWWKRQTEEWIECSIHSFRFTSDNEDNFSELFIHLDFSFHDIRLRDFFHGFHYIFQRYCLLIILID